MSQITHTIRMAVDAQKAIKEIRNYQNEIVGTSSKVNSLMRDLGGDTLLRNAHNYTAAVEKLGGVTNVTAANQARVNKELQAAIAHYQQIGRTAPTAMLELEKATRQAETRVSSMSSVVGKFGPMLLGMFSVGAVTSGVRSLVQWADDLDEVSQGIGVNVVSLQKLQYAWSTTGSSMEAGIKAIQAMGEGISDGSARKAIEKLGLDFEAIKRMAPEQQFSTITGALRGVTDEALYWEIGADIYKKSWKSLGISVKNDMAGVMAQAKALTEEEIRSIAALQGAWEAFALRSKVLAGQIVGGLAKGANAQGIAGAALFEVSRWLPGWMGGDALGAKAVDLVGPLASAENVGAVNRSESGTAPVVKLAKAVDLLKGHFHALAAQVYSLAEVMDDGTNSLAGYYEATTGLTAEGLIPAWTALNDLVTLLPEYEGSLDTTRNTTEDTAKATTGWRSELSGLAQSFRLLQQSSGEGGLGNFAQTMSVLFGSMELGVKGVSQFGLGLNELEKTAPDATKAMSQIASGAIQMAAAMEQATQSTSRAQNAISGAATGAAMGANPALMAATSGMSVFAGAAIGGLYGYSKDTPGDDVTQQMKDQWLATYGGYDEMIRLMSLAGASVDQFNYALRAGEDDLSRYQGALSIVNEQLSAWKKTQDSLRAAGLGTKTLADSIGIATTQAQFQRLGTYTSAIFGKMLKESGSLAEALAAVSDTLDAMLEASAKFGFSASGPLAELLGLRSILTNNPDLSARVTGLGQIGAGLGPALLKSMNLVPTFGADLSETFGQLTGRGGVSQDQALLLMQKPLQQLWEASKSQAMWRQLDAETQALLKLAQDQGFVGEDMKDVSMRQLDVLTQIRDLLAGTPVPDDGWGEGPSAPGIPGTRPRPGGGRPDRTFADGSGGFQWFGSGTRAMLHGWEAVVRPQDLAGGSSAPIVIQTPIYLDGRQIAMSTVRHLPDAVRRYGVH